MFPSVEFGISRLTGLIAAGLSEYFTIRFFSAVGTHPENDEEAEEIILQPILTARRFKKKRKQ